jgi:uncharacterized membrane protein (UPF0127 family)
MKISYKKSLIIWLSIGALIIIFVLALCWARQNMENVFDQVHFDQINGYQYSSIALKVGQTTYLADVANTDELRELGLGDRPSLQPQHAMLFAFATSGMYAFWMKDMQFSIDMVWLDENGKIIYIAKNVSPDTYPAGFESKSPALYVVELPAGTADLEKINIGDQIFFDKNLLKTAQ